MTGAYGSGRRRRHRAPNVHAVRRGAGRVYLRRGAEILDLYELDEAVLVAVDEPQAPTRCVEERAAMVTTVTAVDVDLPSDVLPDDFCGGHRPPPFRRRH